MQEQVIVKAFSGSELISERRFDLSRYYDADIPEIDDSAYIIAHKIDRVEQHFVSDSGTVLRISYYNHHGTAYQFDEIKNGVCTTEKL